MSRFKLGFAAVLLTAIAGVAPLAHAAPVVKVMIVGASGTWQALGVAAFRGGLCPGGGGNCAHYTNSGAVLTDTRKGINFTDTNTVWVVWDHTGDTTGNTSNVWAYIKVDSIVGNRCYFARPHCLLQLSSFPIQSNITLPAPAWGTDTVPPMAIQSLFTTGIRTNVASSEIRPEDALFAQCRINSHTGNASGDDGLDGLGLDQGAGNATGTCPSFGASLTQLEGQDLVSDYPSSTATAHPLAFNISNLGTGTAHDPFTNSTIPAYSQVPLGASPLIFITARAGNSTVANRGSLASVTNATLAQLQAAFSGANCDASNFAGGGAGTIDVYTREPLSGTMNTAEYSALRLPLSSTGHYAGISQMTGLTGLTKASSVACANVGGVHGVRRSVIGTGEEVKFILNSNSGNTGFDQTDGIGYTFFSYGNVSSIQRSANYGYLTIDGIDPLWQLYGTSGYDDGESSIAGALPGIADVAACSGAFPCPESKIWKGGLSFPHVRDGSYRQWCIVRLISDGTTFTNAQALVASAQASAVTTVPDFVPAVATGADPGMKLFRSHYLQQDSTGVTPHNQQDPVKKDVGGEEGGCIVPSNSLATSLVQRNTGCALGN